MKFLKFFAFALLISSFAIFTGCSKDDEDVDLGPTISLKTGEGYTSSDFEVFNDSTVLFGIVANKSTTHNNLLSKLNIYYNELTLLDSTLNTANFSGDFEIKFIGIGTGKLRFKITAEGGLTDETSLNVTILESPVVGVEVDKNSGVELGSFNDPVGSFYSTTERKAYKVAEAMLEQGKIDFLFFKGVTNLNTIAAPDDEDAATISDFHLTEWTTKNPTRFYLADITAEDFDAIEDKCVFPEFDAEKAETKANELKNNDVIFFKTVGDKLGYIKIVDLYHRGDRIKFDVIVMK
ncbi:MAG TPA: hypothetical protein PLQ84_09120 [Bacteroidales bacterium]|nr:hypothetical protein [Bacteroidales bacterium]HQF02249.1 hypothetical protein [Bacteroidales bacterium]HQH15394.1 hypothetical protein [Bacteroidales bacterium]